MINFTEHKNVNTIAQKMLLNVVVLLQIVGIYLHFDCYKRKLDLQKYE